MAPKTWTRVRSPGAASVDAGARDEGGTAYLREPEIRLIGDERLAPSDREVLAKTLHRAAADVPN